MTTPISHWKINFSMACRLIIGLFMLVSLASNIILGFNISLDIVNILVAMLSAFAFYKSMVYRLPRKYSGYLRHHRDRSYSHPAGFIMAASRVQPHPKAFSSSRSSLSCCGAGITSFSLLRSPWNFWVAM